MVKIAVIDEFYIEDIDICNIVEIEKSQLKTSSHGRDCVSILKKYIPNSQIDGINIFNDTKASTIKLIKALEYCLRSVVPYHYINISLGTEDMRYNKKIDILLREISKKGTKIIAAFNNNLKFSYPAYSRFVYTAINKKHFSSSKSIIPLENLFVVDNLWVNKTYGFSNSYAAPTLILNFIEKEVQKPVEFESLNNIRTLDPKLLAYKTSNIPIIKLNKKSKTKEISTLLEELNSLSYRAILVTKRIKYNSYSFKIPQDYDITGFLINIVEFISPSIIFYDFENSILNQLSDYSLKLDYYFDAKESIFRRFDYEA